MRKPDRNPKRHEVSDELDELRQMAVGPLDAALTDRLHQALRSPHNRVVARAAGIVRERQLDGFTQTLLESFERFRDLPAKCDSGCLALLAVLEALDFTNCSEPRPFLLAARMVRLEPAMGGPVDTAGPLRTRGILALANLGYADILLLAAELLADREAPVRQAAAEALVHCGARAGAGLLLLVTSGSEDDPSVLAACFSGLVALAPDWALPRLRPLLVGRNALLRELAATALGSSRGEEALDLLLELVENSPLAAERKVFLTAVGLHRSDRALETLVDVIRSRSAPDAVAAVQALGFRRFEGRVLERVREAVAQRSDGKRSDGKVEKAFTEAFAPEEP